MIVNLQRKIKIETAPIREFAKGLSETIEEAKSGTFSIAFVSNSRMKELNRFFRGKDSTTDVLSFPYEPDEFGLPEGATQDIGPFEDETRDDFLGDIVISAEEAERQAKDNGLTLENEIKQLILHGLLHLCGYDHETDDGEMNKIELRLRRKLKI